MTVGDKIKKIRTFRGMTQKELGLAIGFEEKGADNRIAPQGAAARSFDQFRHRAVKRDLVQSDFAAETAHRVRTG